LVTRYRLKIRAERQQETRRRIVEAAVELHNTVGPSRTTDAAIANRAGVTRMTFYRHFPSEVSLFRACTLHGLAKWPPPDPEPWRRVRDPFDRLRLGLRELYAYYRVAGPGLAVLARDAPLMRSELFTSPSRFDRLRLAGAILFQPFATRGRRRKLLAAVINHAAAVTTWQSLVQQQGLADGDAVELLISMARAAHHRAKHARVRF
jgi:AcrR family transcriptional regulator